MNEKKNNELSLEALEAELRQMPEPAVPAELEGKLLADIPAGKRAPRVWYQVRLVRTAAAAAMIIAGIGLITWLTGGNGGATVAWADVLEQVEKLQTVTFMGTNKIIGQAELDEQSSIMRATYMKPGLLRWDMENADIHMVLIIDFQKKKVLTLNPATKTGRITEIEASSPSIDVIEKITNFRDGSEKELGVREIDGHRAVGFEFHKYATTGEMEYTTVWADVQTNLPIRIEHTIARENTKHKITVTEIKFDVELDESLFSLEPEGYTIESGNVIMRFENAR